MNRIVLWLKSLNPRERNLVLAAGGLLIALFLYLAAIAPIYRYANTRLTRVERKAADLAWMRAMAPTVRTLAMSNPGATSGESMVVLIDRTARQAGLASSLTGQTPNGDRGMRVRLEGASFDSIVGWIGSLQQSYGVSVESAAIDRTDKSGIVNASLVLTRSAS